MRLRKNRLRDPLGRFQEEREIKSAYAVPELSEEEAQESPRGSETQVHRGRNRQVLGSAQEDREQNPKGCRRVLLLREGETRRRTDQLLEIGNEEI